MFTRACWEHRQCVADVSETFLTFVYLTECSPTVVCCWALFEDILPMVIGDETSGEYFNAFIAFCACPDALVKHDDYSRTSLIISELLALCGAAPGMPKFVHYESIERSKRHRGTIALGSFSPTST